MSSAYTQPRPRPHRVGAAHVRNLVSPLLRATWRLDVSGSHHLPAQGPVLLAANHIGLIDGVVLVSAAPRPVHLLAPVEALVAPWDRVMAGAGPIAYDAESPDRAALHAAVDLLADGAAVGVFPEGRRGRGDGAAVQDAWAYLMGRSGAPVVPVAVLGTRHGGAHPDSLPRIRSRVHVVFGEVMSDPPSIDPTRRASLALGSEWLRQRLADHVTMAVARTGCDLPDDPAGSDDRAPLPHVRGGRR